MKIWTGKFFLFTVIGTSLVGLMGCSTQEHKVTKGPSSAAATPAGATPSPFSSVEESDAAGLKSDRAAIDELRKDVPVEIKESNDRLAETLARWKASKMEPDRLREKFNDEIRKRREAFDKKLKKARDDFQRDLSEKRAKFLDDLKAEREKFYSLKPTSQQRTDFSSKQSESRDRYFGDERDLRADFDGNIRDERKDFEDDVANRWLEFRQEFPEYSRLYREMKQREDKEHEENLKNPKPTGGPWPYKYPGEESSSSSANGGSGQSNSSGNSGNAGNGAGGANENGDVNKGGNGWPSSDPNEFNQIPGKKSGP